MSVADPEMSKIGSQKQWQWKRYAMQVGRIQESGDGPPEAESFVKNMCKFGQIWINICFSVPSYNFTYNFT